MHVGFVTQWYDPEPGAAAVPGSIARALAERGNEVTVLTGFPNYPGGILFDGYRQRLGFEEVIDDITVHRSPLYTSHDKSAVRRAMNYCSFAATSTIAVTSALGATDVVLVYSGPITAALPAMRLRRHSGQPFVLLVEDMWPQSVTASAFLSERASAYAERRLHKLCDAVYRRSAKIAATSPGMVGLISSRGIPEEKISYIPNWADENVYLPTQASANTLSAFSPRRPFTAMYAGNLGNAQGLEVIIEVAAMLRDRVDIGFALVGGGVAEESLQRDVSARGLDNVTFFGAQSPERMAEVLAVADVQLISLRDSDIATFTLPSKLQTILAAGRPVIGAVAGDAAAIIAASQAGWAVPPGSAPALASAITRMSALSERERAALAESGHRYYMQELSRATGAQRLEGLLVEACG